MNYYFEKLEALVNSIVCDTACETLSANDAGKLADSFAEEKERIRTYIIEEAFNTPEQKMMELLIDKQQSVITRLLNQLHKTKKSLKTNEHIITILYGHVEELRHFIKTNYGGFFNMESPLPLLEHHKLTIVINTLLKNVSKKTCHDVDEKLAKLFLSQINGLLTSAEISYKKADYIQTIVDRLQADGILKDSETADTQFKLFLIAANFNDGELIKYFTKEWRAEIDKEETTQEKLRILKYHLKELKQCFQIPGLSLHEIQASLKEQLLLWLNEEVSYYELELSSSSTDLTNADSESKIHTSMSVPQLALFVRLLKEDEQIINTNQSELLRIVSGCFTTIKKEAFSYGHLHGKYYKIEAHTRRAVYDMLMRLLHLSRKIGMD